MLGHVGEEGRDLNSSLDVSSRDYTGTSRARVWGTNLLSKHSASGGVFMMRSYAAWAGLADYVYPYGSMDPTNNAINGFCVLKPYYLSP